MGGYRHILFISASILTLSVSGCMEGSDSKEDAAGEATAFSERPSSGRLVERDVEAPEVFQTTDQGLWDGRPSLGGVWVAYPDVTDPERVIIRNDSNGKFVIGALFKREREHPGPKLQVSSDAAAALGMLAGAPTTLDVTALRREEPAPVAEEPVADAQEDALPEAVVAATAATGATVAAADDAVADAADVVEPANATETASAAGDVIEPAEKKRGWNPFRRKPKEAEPVVTDEVSSVAEVASEAVEPAEIMEATTEVAALSDPEIVAPATPAKKQRWNPFKRKQKDAVTAAAVTTGALATGEVTSQSLGAAPRVIADEPAAAPEARMTSSNLDKPFVQIGIFSVESNANNTATALRQNGVVPQVYMQESSGKTFWRVVAGPANTKVDRAALIKKVKGMGFSDAYAVSG